MSASVHAQVFLRDPSDVALTVRNGDANLRIGDLSVYPMGTPAEQAMLLDCIAALCRSASASLVPERGVSSEDAPDAPLGPDGLPDVPVAETGRAA